jgi:hypothetical protein
VPLVRGAQRSRAIGDILAEVQGLARSGVVEVTLLGQNVNTYGRDVTVPGSSNRPLFGELLRQVGVVEGIRRVRFTSPHPHDFTPDVIEAMAETPSVCEHIHFPLQSGSDRVLKAMRRSYRRDRYLGWLDAIRRAIPDVAVSTDVIVGFPGETEEDFADTLDLVERARFDSAYTFQYSPRPGTRAASFEDQIPKAVVQERFDRLVELQQRISLERSLAQVGATFEVPVEGPASEGPRHRLEPGPTGSCTSPTRSSRDRSSTPGSPRPPRITWPASWCRRRRPWPSEVGRHDPTDAARARRTHRGRQNRSVARAGGVSGRGDRLDRLDARVSRDGRRHGQTVERRTRPRAPPHDRRRGAFRGVLRRSVPGGRAGSVAPDRGSGR